MTIDQELIKILACPVCRGPLEVVPGEHEGEVQGFKCPSCAVIYPVRDDIPVLLKEEGIRLMEWEAGKR